MQFNYFFFLKAWFWLVFIDVNINYCLKMFVKQLYIKRANDKIICPWCGGQVV